ncbi:MAG TPA: hypothetical protein VMF52_03690 [Steroidobacteraceae bacterium]|nr:hypothetical protein [Steroidobacteraceae bacterium]
MREREATQKFLVEMGGSLVLYAIVVSVSLRAAPHVADGIARTALMLSPMIPALLGLWAFMRQVGRMDEFVRLRNLQALSIAGGVTALFSLTWGFLENVGYPRLSMFVIWMVFGLSWGTVSLFHGVYCKLRAQ